MEERVVNVPLAAGINQEDDQFSVSPPEMAVLKNVSAVKKGALDTRLGFSLVTTGGATAEPATAFVGNTISNVSRYVEAFSSNSSEQDSRAVIISNKKFYEYVGKDAAHGWREVNAVPAFVGTLSSTASTGGPIIEIESVVLDGRRFTAWTTGQRNGNELSSDFAYKSQVAGDGNSLYYSVQDDTSEAFIIPPTRMLGADGNPVTSAINLRLTYSLSDSVDIGLEWPLIAWYNITAGRIESALVRPTTGIPLATVQWSLPAGITSLQLCHRNFDIVGLSSVLFPTSCGHYVYAYCPADQGNTTNQRIVLGLVRIPFTTGALSPISSTTATIYSTPGGTGFQHVGSRGVVLERKPAVEADVNYTWKVTGALGARIISQYVQGYTPQSKLDGQLALARFQFWPTGAVTNVTGFKYIPYIGFETQDDVKNVLTANQLGSWRYSGSPKTERAIKTGVVSPSTPVALPIPGPLQGSTFKKNSEWTVETNVAYNSSSDAIQVYFCDINTSSDSLYTLSPRASLPYAGSPAAGLDGSGGQYRSVRGAFPDVAHRYPGDRPIDSSSCPSPLYQINMIDIEAATANSGWNNGTFTNVQVMYGGNQVATATVCVQSGSIVAVALQRCLPGIYWTALGTNYATGISFQGGSGGGIGAGTLTGARAWGLLSNVQQTLICSDEPNRSSLPPNNDFYFAGQMEHCVHRWDVASDTVNDRVLCVLSSASATPLTNPQGDVPYGSVSPHRYNSFCELYAVNIPLNFYQMEPIFPLNGGSTNNVVYCALGGPWRLVGGLAKNTTTGQWYCALSPAGDDSQCSVFLMRLVYESPLYVITPNPQGSEASSFPTASAVTYSGNKGMFVEAANIMRTHAPPLNVPQLQLQSDLQSFWLGSLRQGSAKGTQECFAIGYESLPRNWRQMVRMSDYTFINGGVLSVYDGVNCNEYGILVWPQRDLTSISWGDGGAQPLKLAFGQSSDSSAFKTVSYTSGLLKRASFFNNITRPFWFYEAGMYGNSAYGQSTTDWGGDPSANYEAIYADARVQQFAPMAKQNSNGGSSAYGPHYYGRFQATPTDFSNDNKLPIKLDAQANSNVSSSYFLWAPRSAKGWTYPDLGTVKGNGESYYSASESGGNFFMSWCYEYADGTGRMTRSAPSVPTQYTICAEIISTDPDADRDSGKRRRGGTVTRFEYGFFAPRLELTNRVQSASSDPRRVMLQPYSTCEPYSTVMYRMPLKNFLNPVSDFVVPRNATRGVVARATIPYSGFSAGDHPCGYVITNMAKVATPTDNTTYNACFDGSNGEYMGMLREPYLYTTGGVLDNVAPPGCKAMCVHQNRLVIGGADDPTVVWFTKELTPTDAPGFNDLLTISIEAGGAVTGLASMNSNLIIFKKNDIYIVSGSMPDATGQSSSLSEPVRLPSGIGCTDHRSVLSTPVGVFFRSERSIELLTPDLQVRPVGDKIMDILASSPFVTGVAHSAKAQEVYFMLHDFRDSGVNVMTPRLMVYSYMINAWYEWTIDNLGGDMGFITTVNDAPWVALAQLGGETFGTMANVYFQSYNEYVDGIRNVSGPNYTYSFYPTQLTTAPFAMNQVQGFQRVKRARLLLKSLGGDMGGVVFTLGTDTSQTQSVTFTATNMSNINVAQGGTLQLETHVAYQKGQFLQLGMQTTAPVSVSSATAGYRLSNIALVVGLKQGLNKRITEEAKK